MLENLTVALDGSPCSQHACEFALGVATFEHCALDFCSVADPFPVYGTLEPSVLIEHTWEDIQGQARLIVSEAVEKARAAGIAADGTVREGDPVFEILAFSKQMEADAIVIGTHGRSGLRRLFMGSVAEGVLRRAPIPVIAVRADARILQGKPQARQVKVLVPIDGSKPSVRALDVAVEFAESLDAELILCNVVSLTDVALRTGGEAQLMPGVLEESEAFGKTLLDEGLARIGSRVRACTRSVDGETVEGIKRLADETAANLIVIGRHGRSGQGRVVMGSVAEGVMRVAPVPVVVVPARAGRPVPAN